MLVTVKDIMDLEPCEEYTQSRVEDLFAGRRQVTLVEIAHFPIPAEDRLWALLQLIKDDRVILLFACDCAERALPLFEAERPDDMRPRRAIEVARAYAKGETTLEELRAARAAAWDAAWDAAGAARAARAAAGAAAWDAAWATARDAAWDAGAAAWDAGAAGDAERAWVAEREWQLSKLIEYIK